MAAAQSPRGLTLPGSSGDVADSESGEGPEGGAAGSQAPAAPPLLTSQVGVSGSLLLMQFVLPGPAHAQLPPFIACMGG